jgi:hypothetical protein
VKNAGRSPQLDALAFYVATGVGTPRSPLATEPAARRSASRSSAGRQPVRRGQLRVVPRRRRLGVGTLQPAAGDADGVARPGRRRPVRRAARRGDVHRDRAQRAEGQRHHRGRRAGLQPAVAAGAFALAPYLHNGSARRSRT